MIDVSTPSTVIRYTNNWKGSFEGWVLSPRIGFKSMKKRLPGLRNFYMVGQWVEPGGGLPAAIMSGRNVCQIICKEDKKRLLCKLETGLTYE
jgi:phytoene dehydrogenase-like protein